MTPNLAAASGGLLGAAAALPVVRFAALTAHHPSASPRWGRALLMALAVSFGVAATARLGLPMTAVTLTALIPAAAAAVVDAHERRLPDPLTATVGAVVAAPIAVLLALGSRDGLRATTVFGAGAAACLLAKYLFPDAIGWGDVKLVPSLAALLALHGWPTLYTGLLAWSGLILLTALRNLVNPARNGIVAYGPALVAGTASAIFIAG